MSGAMTEQMLRLAAALHLGARVREVPREELGFVIVNETVQAIAYDQAALWDARSRKVAALSGASRVEAAAPYVGFLRRFCGRFTETTPAVVRPLPGEATEADEFLGPELLWCPFVVGGDPIGGLLLARRAPWTEGDIQLMATLAGGFAQSWELARARRARLRPGFGRRIRQFAILLLAAGVLALGAVPIPSSAIAPAEIVADAPAFVRAPFAGVIDSIAVAPNQPVTAGQIIVRLDRRQLEAQQRVAEKASEVAEANYRQASQEAISDPKAREQLAVLRSKLDEARADLEYRRTLLSRAAIPTPAAGIAVYNDPADWIGRPVETGERIMQVAAPISRRVEIELPVGEAITLEPGARVLFFDNLNPDRPTEAVLTRASYTTTMSLAGVLVYVCDAALEGEASLRLGLKGSAKIFGPPRPLALWLLRRPIAWLREVLG